MGDSLSYLDNLLTVYNVPAFNLISRLSFVNGRHILT